MPHRSSARRPRAAWLLVTLLAAGCAVGGPAVVPPDSAAPAAPPAPAGQPPAAAPAAVPASTAMVERELHFRIDPATGRIAPVGPYAAQAAIAASLEVQFDVADLTQSGTQTSFALV